MEQTEELYWYWINNIEGIGYQGIKKLLSTGKTPKQIFDSKEKELERVLTKNQIKAISQSKDIEKIVKGYKGLKKRGIQFLSIDHSDYPERLRRIDSPPFALYVRGKLPEKGRKTIAIIGSRQSSVYGQEMAKYFGRELSKSGISVISGMARGIDSIAQQSAIQQEGGSYGVLGCGVDICYPKESFSLYHDLIMKGGIVSEYPPGTIPKAGLFPRRNRIISGMSDGILVIEAKEKSGTLITVDWALEQGKDIYAVPGRAFDTLSEGCNRLIQMGAKLVMSIEDFQEEFPSVSMNLSKNYENNQKTLAKNQRVVYCCLSLEPKYIDSIIKETKLSVQEVLSTLFELEVSGLITQVISNYYIVSK